MTRKKVERIKWCGLAFLVTLILVFILRTFFIQSYMVSSSQMETSLLKGEYLLVDKTAYGTRMPITLLSMPFTFDSFLGFKSYNELLQLRYKRLNGERISRNDIVLFNNPLDTGKPIDKRPLLLSRCIALPGDTLTGDSNKLFVNGQKYVFSPDVLNLYHYNTKHENEIISVMKLFSIPLRRADDTNSNSVHTSILLNNYEIFILDQQLPSSYLIESNINDSAFPYGFVIPAKNMKIELTDYNIMLYKDIILDERQNKLEWKNNRLYEDNILIKSYEFKENYYWFVSDNPHQSIDSRRIGFVSEKYIIGKASYIILSTSDEGINWDRSFTAIH